MASELIESKLKNLPDLPGCYIMRNANDDIIYIGKAKNLKKIVFALILEAPMILKRKN